MTSPPTAHLAPTKPLGEPEKTKKQPTHTLYILPTTAATDESWIAAGAGWINKDGSVNVIVNRELTAGTRVQIRVRRPREAPQESA